MLHPERIRERMDEQKPTDQTEWRIEPYGWDSKDRTYFLLDDDRLYRKTDAPPPTDDWKPKKNTKKAKAAARAAKRRRVSRATAVNADDTDDGPATEAEEAPEPEDDDFGGAKWECIAVTLGEVQAFLSTIRKTRDENEKILRDRIEEGLVPILEKHEEARKRKELAREKELLVLEKLSHAKRSSRIADKLEKRKLEEHAHEEEEKRHREEEVARKEDLKRRRLEKERDHRLMSREVRLREREARRLQHEEELAQLSEDSKHLSSDVASRMSERHLKVELERKKQALKQLEEEEADWIFDCICGVYGQIDDGTHSIACEKCSVWMHSKCVGVSEKEADSDDFHFVCNTCKRKMANPRPTVIKLKVKNHGDALSSPPRAQTAETTAPERFVVEVAAKPSPKPEASAPISNGLNAHYSSPALSGPRLQEIPHSRPSSQHSIPVKHTGQTNVLPPPSPYANGDGPNPFSSPHPTLSPPQQSPNKSRAYSTINQSPPSSMLNLGEHRSLPPKGFFHVSPKVNGVPQLQPPRPTSSTDVHRIVSSSPTKTGPRPNEHLQSTDKSSPVLYTPPASFTLPAHQSSSSNSPSLLTTPHLKQDQVGLSNPAVTPTLPPIQNGISPLKRSPPTLQQSSKSSHFTPAPAILPPVAALSPSPSQQIMTPPVKSVEPVRPLSQQSNDAAGGS